VIVEAGRAHFEVVHRHHTSWLVRTGPFAVRVTGTKFDTEYEPLTDQFILNVTEGSVVVSGCGLGQGRVVEARQGLQASCTPRSLPSPPPPAAPLLPAIKSSSSELRGVVVPRAVSAGSGAWRRQAHEGRYADAYDLLKGNFEHACRNGGASEVWLLGDVARLTGHAREAQQAYTAIRDRFPATTTSTDAAFALGRLAIEHDGVAAERWFETTIRERPEGPLARAALGRIMELQVARRDQTAATATAQDYLRRYPAGPLAGEARVLLNAPPK
jgi:hypothetical protein